MYMDLIQENSGRYDMEKLSVNSNKGFDFGGSFYGKDKLVFASNRGSSIKGHISTWDGMSYLDLYEATISEDGSLGEPKKLKGSINSKYHESTPVFTQDGSTVYFTRNNITSSEKIKKDNSILL